MAEAPINLRKPESIRIGDARGNFRTGCAVIEATFPNVQAAEVEQICFKNSYTALLTIKMKTDAGEWQVLVSALRLMPNPHFVGGSEDTFRLTKKHFLRDTSRVCGLRFILQQPSPVWKDFGIEEIKVFKPAPQPSTVTTTLPQWLLTSGEDASKKKPIGTGKVVGSVEQLSSTLQQMWAVAEKVGQRQPTRPLGRYDIDGCYDINLLSYM